MCSRACQKTRAHTSFYFISPAKKTILYLVLQATELTLANVRKEKKEEELPVLEMHRVLHNKIEQPEIARITGWAVTKLKGSLSKGSLGRRRRWGEPSLFKSYLFVYFNLYCIFPSPFSPFILPPPSNHHLHSVAHVNESFFLFAQSLHFLTSPTSCHPVLHL